MKKLTIRTGVVFSGTFTDEELTALFSTVAAGDWVKAMAFFEVEPVIGFEPAAGKKRGPVPATLRFRSPEGELVEATVADFAERAGLSQSSVRAIIAGRRPAARGWTYVGAGADLREVA